MGISTLVASIARTAEQAGGLNAIVAISLAAVGGVFIPISQAPEALGRAAPGHAALLVPARDREPRGAVGDIGDLAGPIAILLAWAS